MSDRMTIQSMAQDVFNYYKQHEESLSDATKGIQDAGVKDFIDVVINEPLPDRDSIQLTDSAVVRANHPNWSLEMAKKYASETIGLEEQFRFFQLYCQPPKKDKEPISLARPETQLFCSYFKDKWQNVFPTTSNSLSSKTILPLTPDIIVQDGDTSASAMEEAAGVPPEFHEVRLPGPDTQESVDNDVITEEPEGLVIPVNWKQVEEPFCYQRAIPNARYCIYHVVIPNTKVDRQVNEVWDALVRLVEVKNPKLSEKLKNSRFIEEMRPVGQLATKYRGKLATMIHENLVEYVKKNTGNWGWEPSYAVKNAWEETEKHDGRLEAVDKYGRLLMWYVLGDKKDLFVQYLSDEENGLSALAAGPLKAYYEESKGPIERAFSKIKFGKYGLNSKDVKELKKLFMSSVMDPSQIYSRGVTARMAPDWKETSEQLNAYHYTNNLNLFLIFLGQGVDTSSFFPNIRSATSYFLGKKAAESKYGIFVSEILFQAYATNKQKKEQLGQP